MSKSLNEEDKLFLTKLLNESIQQIRAKALYENSPDRISRLVDNITHIRKIAKKLDLKYITSKLS